MRRAFRRLLDHCVLLGLTAASFGTQAQGIYVAAGAGASQWGMDCGSSGCDRSATALRLAAGYRFNRVIALEAFQLDLGRARSSSNMIDGELRSRGTGVETILGGQIGDVELAGKIGLASMRNDFRAAPSSFDPSERRTRTEVIFGAMLAYRFTPQLALRFDLDFVTVALNGDFIFYSRGADVSTLTMGLAYRF